MLAPNLEDVIETKWPASFILLEFWKTLTEDSIFFFEGGMAFDWR